MKKWIKEHWTCFPWPTIDFSNLITEYAGLSQAQANSDEFIVVVLEYNKQLKKMEENEILLPSQGHVKAWPKVSLNIGR